MPVFLLDYLFKNTPRTHSLELDQPEPQAHEAALHLLELHFGDAENSLMMPNADATPDEVLAKAELLGLTQIRVSRQPAQ
ncbi:hypothetical protein V2I80_08095 [Pseudomonas viridiflava]|uniref:hypothetical protein n=1 Tax=Pseudomonas syringae group TaxID=136849 RepID=UPI000F03B5DA|nr:hypothetical protein [Pseudomonas viridiflava]MCF9020110.1 hypothetical protein [Pseudomonas syringae]MBV1807490.1 hypothetical protein [Pseudomonas viridiflava]MEE3913468.1 hypothetical protein [Pseudomonas viridiflava]MEE3972088.1 hypothetical protein [Pseudomonas viridiflava]MEE4017160.1 hypothetical protein [Pseudomonas viridiflava]